MRRLITMLASALVLLAIGFSSSYSFAWNTPTALYLAGNVNGNENWSPDRDVSKMTGMTKISDTEWELQITAESWFRIYSDSNYEDLWYAKENDNSDGNWDLYASATDIVAVKTGQDCNMSNTSGKKFHVPLSLVNKYLYIKWDNTPQCKVSIKDKSSKPEETNPNELYIYSTVDYKNPLITLTKTSDGVYSTTLDESTLNAKFTKNSTCYFFISKEKKSASSWNDFTGVRYSPDKNMDMNANEKVDMKADGAENFFFMNDESYSQVEITANINGSAQFTFKKTKKSTQPVEDYVYLFGVLGYGNTSWDGNYQNQGKLKLTSTDGDKKIYTGVVKFKQGKNEFLIYGDKSEQYAKEVEQSGSNEGYKIMQMGKLYYAEQKKSDSKYYGNFLFTTTAAAEYDVEVERFKAHDYSIKIVGKAWTGGDAPIYLYDTKNMDQPVLELTHDGRGVFSASVELADIENIDNDFFIYTEHKTGTGLGWADFSKEGKRWTCDNSNNVTITNSGSCDLKQSNTGSIKWNLTEDKSKIFGVRFKADLNNGKFYIELDKDVQDWYLSGDINNWATKFNKGKDILEDYRFSRATAEDNDILGGSHAGWYVLKLNRMHGQFQIHDGAWADEAGGDGANHAKFTHILTDGKSKEYLSSTVAESVPESANVRHQESGNVVLRNLHLAHNYYNDASIYLNPSKKKLFINGAPEDLYIYFYNAEKEEGCNGKQVINIVAKDENKNELNYYYDESFLNHKMEWVKLEGKELEAEAIESKVLPQKEDGCKWVYRSRIAPGLEEPYQTQVKQDDGSLKAVEHRFVFYVKNTSKISNDLRHAIVGHNFYFIYNNNRPTVLLNYQVKEFTGDNYDYREYTHSHANVEKICFRILAFNYENKLQYLTENFDTETGDRLRTDKRSEAQVFIFNDVIKNSEHGDFTPSETKFGKTENWNAVVDNTATNSVSYLAQKDVPAWHEAHNVVRMREGDVNRYIEIQVTRKDPDSEDANPGVFHEFYSDFVYDKNDVDSGVGDASSQNGAIGVAKAAETDAIDKYATITNKLKQGNDLNPQYKLSGVHLFTQALGSTAIPTGVKPIIGDAESETPVYYNLQGVRVAHPDKGIYIMVKGKTSKKVRF